MLVNELRQDRELVEHTEGDGAASGLYSCGTSLEKEGLDSADNEGFGGIDPMGVAMGLDGGFGFEFDREREREKERER